MSERVTTAMPVPIGAVVGENPRSEAGEIGAEVGTDVVVGVSASVREDAPGGAAGPELVILFGGTFDPPHRGHVELPARVRDELERRMECVGKGWLVYVPAARSPHKEKGPAASDADRVEMVRRSLEGVERVGVWTEEIDRARGGKQQEERGLESPCQEKEEHGLEAHATEGKEHGLESPCHEEKEHGRDAHATERATEPSYTVDTVWRARAWLNERGMSQTALRLLIGADQALGFHRWRSPREIAQTAGPVVMVRGDVADSDDLVLLLKRTRYWRREELEMWREGMVEVGRLDVSATMVRRALRDGDETEIGKWLMPGVVEYIRERGLYGVG